jgi:ABC-type microcin C transport system duplicated ATPase subunit YejF
MQEPIVQLANVGKTFVSRDGERRVLEDITLDIHRGERIAVTGDAAGLAQKDRIGFLQ